MTPPRREREEEEGGEDDYTVCLKWLRFAGWYFSEPITNIAIWALGYPFSYILPTINPCRVKTHRARVRGARRAVSE